MQSAVEKQAAINFALSQWRCRLVDRPLLLHQSKILLKTVSEWRIRMNSDRVQKCERRLDNEVFEDSTTSGFSHRSLSKQQDTQEHVHQVPPAIDFLKSCRSSHHSVFTSFWATRGRHQKDNRHNRIYTHILPRHLLIFKRSKVRKASKNQDSAPVVFLVVCSPFSLETEQFPFHTHWFSLRAQQFSFYTQHFSRKNERN